MSITRRTLENMSDDALLTVALDETGTFDAATVADANAIVATR